MNNNGSLIEKKLRGSGGYTVAKINDTEQKTANLGGPELFLAGIGRLETDRFVKYHCNRCEKDYDGAPNIQYENPNEDLGENIILIEKGEYKCKSCNSVIAQYRKFNDVKENNTYLPDNTGTKVKTDIKESMKKSELDNKEIMTQPGNNNSEPIDLEQGERKEDYSPIEDIIGLSVYNNNANFIGKISEIGLRKISEGKIQFSFKITNSSKKETIEVAWDSIGKIGDIVILQSFGNSPPSYNGNNNTNSSINQNYKTCINCNYQNDTEALFCEECGKKIE